MQVGNWIREHRGIYRLALFPAAEHPDLVKWALWSRNRNEVTEGVKTDALYNPAFVAGTCLSRNFKIKSATSALALF